MGDKGKDSQLVTEPTADILWVETTITADLKTLTDKLTQVDGLSVAERATSEPRIEASLRDQQEQLLLEVAEAAHHLHRNYQQYNDMLKIGQAPLPRELHKVATPAKPRGHLSGALTTQATLTVDCRESAAAQVRNLSNVLGHGDSNISVSVENWSRPDYEAPEISLYRIAFNVLDGSGGMDSSMAIAGWCAVSKYDKAAVDFLSASAKYGFDIAPYIFSAEVLLGDRGVSLGVMMP